MKVNLTYFKASGKYYAGGEYETNKEHMFEIFDEVKDMKRSGKPLPGLIGSWKGPILIDAVGHPMNYPGLAL